jgi:hypothetical protein
MMRIWIAIAICLAAFLTSVAQHGGKAEPNRIQFTGTSSRTVTGTLSNGQEAEYVFAATKGQTVKISNTRTSLFDFRVYNEEFDFETEFESSPTLTFEVPETGDYLFFVRKKQVSRPRAARYSLTLTIESAVRSFYDEKDISDTGPGPDRGFRFVANRH